MKVKELIAELQKQDPEKDVLIHIEHGVGGWQVPIKVEANNGKEYFHNGKWSTKEIVGIGFADEYDLQRLKEKEE